MQRPRPQPEPIRRTAIVTHGRPGTLGDALDRVQKRADAAGVEIVDVGGEADLVLALGGDGTMLRALRSTLGRPAPVFGVRYGRVGFLTSAESDQLDSALDRVFGGDFRVVELCTLAARLSGGTHAAINDVVITSSEPGRMVELGWEIAGEALGEQRCDGVICCSPTGSTAYNLSNGGPVMMWGLDAMAMTFVAAHSLHTRPLVVPRGLNLGITNRTAHRRVTVLVDGHSVGELGSDGPLEVALGDEFCQLALLPEVTFFTRYHNVFP
jgi:NAD+ kinase